VDSHLSLASLPLAAPAAGLVSSKTSPQNTFVNLAPSAVADRRVKRLKRSVWASGHLHALAENGFRPSVCWFVTLTYVGVDDWCADHVAKAVDRFRAWCVTTSIECRYTWVAELQGRGAAHYHLLAWLPKGVRMPKWDQPMGRRHAFWRHGMTNTEKAKSGVGYLMKYLSKLGELTRFPKGLRLYGIGGLTHQGRQVRSWFNLPEWAKREYGVGDLSRRNGKLMVLDTGEILATPYRVKLAPSGLSLELLRPLPERFHDGAYSRWSHS
jgi:hypothetical protein